MDHTPYIIAAFVLTGLTIGWLAVASHIAMKRSEALAKDLSGRNG